MKYAKFINEDKIEYAPRNKGRIINYNLPSNQNRLLADGYLPVEETDCPRDGGEYLARYRKNAAAIARVWELQIPEPAPEESDVPAIELS
jgi:hypothetical protein